MLPAGATSILVPAATRSPDPDRGWDAIVIGEYERAFYGNQYASMAPLFEHYGIALWMPEVGGRWTGTPRTMSRPCSHWDCRPSGRSPGPGSGSAPDRTS